MVQSIKISDFKTNLGQVVRSNRFCCDIVPPPELGSLMRRNSVNDALQKIYWHVKSASIPARSIGEYEFKYFGMTYKLTGDTSYSDLVITFINEGSWAVRDFFEKWQELVHIVWNTANNNKGKLETPSSNSDAADILKNSYIDMIQLGLQGEEIAKYRFHAPFPKEVGEIELSMENADTVQEFQVTFAYSYWERV